MNIHPGGEVILMRNAFAITVALALALAFVSYAMVPAQAATGRNDGKVFITDRTGEKWDISQAVNIGFSAKRFQHGIGRWAFKTLDDSHLGDDTKGAPGRMRIIGVAGESENQAYSVRKLSWHEIANTNLDGKPIAVGY